MFARHSAITAVVLAALASGCSDVTDPLAVGATVVVQRDTLVATVTTAAAVQWMHFSLPIAIHNTSDVALSFDYCFSSIDTRIAGEWSKVWSPYCLLAAGSATDIRPGETLQIVLSIDAAIDGPGGPQWGSRPVDGTYRFTAGFIPVGVGGRFLTVGSNAFTLIRGS